MNLVVDIGNSRVKAAVTDGAGVVAVRAFPSSAVAGVGELLAEYPAVGRCIVASTGAGAGEMTGMLRRSGLHVLEMTPLTPVPIGNAYHTPASLGTDRLAAAAGAVEVLGYRDCLIVDFGTAITVDLVSGGVFREGYSIEGPVDRYLPIDVNVPGCPPRPQTIMEGVLEAVAIWRERMEG